MQNRNNTRIHLCNVDSEDEHSSRASGVIRVEMLPKRQIRTREEEPRQEVSYNKVLMSSATKNKVCDYT